jgi:A/G-specific adenine glycosylase
VLNDRLLPWRADWIKFKDPFRVWVSEIMLQQTVIKAVIPVYERFLHQFPTLFDFAAATEEQIRSAVRGLGYYRRFGLMHKAAKVVEAQLKNNGSWPQSQSEWLQLPGIGAYTSAALASIVNQEAVSVVDGNVERVMCRLLDLRIVPNTPPIKRQFHQLLDELILTEDPGGFNQAVMELGQLICVPIAPRCDHCPVSKVCLARERRSQHLAPAQKAKQVFEDVQLGLIIPYDQATGRVQLSLRPETAKFLKRTWGFPTFLKRDGEWSGDGWDVKQTLHIEGFSFRHSITKHKISANAVVQELAAFGAHHETKFVSIGEVESMLVSNLDRKAWHKVNNNLPAKEN